MPMTFACQQGATQIAVMYLGKIMEVGNTDEVFNHPLHPYTKGLLQAVPRPVPRRDKDRPALYGEIPNPLDPPLGCRFAPRCEERLPGCDEVDPPLTKIAEDHLVACRKFMIETIP